MQGWEGASRLWELPRTNSEPSPFHSCAVKQPMAQETCRNSKLEDILWYFRIIKQKRNRELLGQKLIENQTHMPIFFNLRKEKLKLPFIRRDVNEVLNKNAAVPLYKCLYNSGYHTNNILICKPHENVKDKLSLRLIPCEMAAWTSFSNSPPLSHRLLFIYRGTITTAFPFGSRVTASAWHCHFRCLS